MDRLYESMFSIYVGGMLVVILVAVAWGIFQRVRHRLGATARLVPFLGVAGPRWYIAVGFLAAVLFAYFIWPTPYRYFPVPDFPSDVPHQGILATRANRFTDRTEALYAYAPTGWHRFVVPPDAELSPDAVRKVVRLRDVEHRDLSYFEVWLEMYHPGWDKYAAYYAWECAE